MRADAIDRDAQVATAPAEAPTPSPEAAHKTPRRRVPVTEAEVLRDRAVNRLLSTLKL